MPLWNLGKILVAVTLAMVLLVACEGESADPRDASEPEPRQADSAQDSQRPSRSGATRAPLAGTTEPDENARDPNPRAFGVLPPANASEETDRLALIALYNATGRESWDRYDQWDSDRPISEWYGVYVNPYNSRVIGLDLRSNGLEGEIPQELANLSELVYLNLRDNQLYGNIPSELAAPPNLQARILAGNDGLNSEESEKEKEALSQLFADYDDLDRTTPINEWPGVTTAGHFDPRWPERTGRVIRLDLPFHLTYDTVDWIAALSQPSDSGAPFSWLETIEFHDDGSIESRTMEGRLDTVMEFYGRASTLKDSWDVIRNIKISISGSLAFINIGVGAVSAGGSLVVSFVFEEEIGEVMNAAHHFGESLFVITSEAATALSELNCLSGVVSENEAYFDTLLKWIDAYAEGYETPGRGFLQSLWLLFNTDSNAKETAEDRKNELWNIINAGPYARLMEEADEDFLYQQAELQAINESIVEVLVKAIHRGEIEVRSWRDVHGGFDEFLREEEFRLARLDQLERDRQLLVNWDEAEEGDLVHLYRALKSGQLIEAAFSTEAPYIEDLYMQCGQSQAQEEEEDLESLYRYVVEYEERLEWRILGCEAMPPVAEVLEQWADLEEDYRGRPYEGMSYREKIVFLNIIRNLMQELEAAADEGGCPP